MEKTFTFDSDSLAEARNLEHPVELEITIDIWCHSDDGDYGFEDMIVWDNSTDTEIDLHSLPENEVKMIEARAEEIAYECSPDAYQDYIENVGDAAYERYIDDLMDRANEE